MTIVFGTPVDYALEAHFNYHAAMCAQPRNDEKIHRTAIETLVENFVLEQGGTQEKAADFIPLVLAYFQFDDQDCINEQVLKIRNPQFLNIVA